MFDLTFFEFGLILLGCSATTYLYEPRHILDNTKVLSALHWFSFILPIFFLATGALGSIPWWKPFIIYGCSMIASFLVWTPVLNGLSSVLGSSLGIVMIMLRKPFGMLLGAIFCGVGLII